MSVDTDFVGSTDEVRVLDVDLAGREPLAVGQRVLAFLGYLGASTQGETHGLIDYLAIDTNGIVHSLPQGSATMTTDQIRGSGGAAFLDGLSLFEITASIAHRS